MDSAKRYENRLIAILFFSWGTVFLDRTSQHYLAPYFVPEFHLSPSQVGLLGSVVAVTWAISTLFFGALSDRIGRKKILVPAVFLFSLLSWISGMTHSFNQLLLVRGLLGIAEGPAWSIMTALIEESSPPSRRGRNIGIVVSAAALVGLAVSPVLATQVAAHTNWRWAFFVSGVPGFLLGLLIWRFVKEPERQNVPGVHGQAIKIRDFLSVLRHRNMWLCCAGAAGFLTWLFLHQIFAPLYITEVAHQTPTTAGFLLGASGLGSFFLALFFPTLSDRIGRKPVLLLMSVLCAVVPLSLLISPLYSYPWILAGIAALTNAGQGIGALILVLVPTESVPPQFAATAIGLATLAAEIIGAAAAPYLGGRIAQSYGLGATMWMSAGGAALVFVCALLLRETYLVKAGHPVLEASPAN
ncbi:MAG TPA: MFS transporter [Candidatus Angelobacter sp.]|nr:MFS transporter [Candidatus Angelobacter sp.]